jgi:hypothetical protein
MVVIRQAVKKSHRFHISFLDTEIKGPCFNKQTENAAIDTKYAHLYK